MGREAENEIRVNSSRAADSRIGVNKAADSKAAKRVASKAVTVSFEGRRDLFLRHPFLFQRIRANAKEKRCCLMT